MKLVYLFLVALIAMASCESPLEAFSQGNLQFTADLYKEVLKTKPGENFVFSPLSIEIILALTRAGSRGQTEKELTSGLKLPNEEKTEAALQQLLPSLTANNEELKLNSANKLFLGKNLEILDSFNKIATSVFKAGAENVDFSKAEEAANVINQWVEGQTNNKIKNLISPDILDSMTRLVLVNALYMSAKWSVPFENYLTRKEKFHLSQSQTKEVDMMHVEDSFGYYESSEHNAKFIEFPYLGDNLSMVVALPNDIEGLARLENKIEEVLKPKKFQYERVAVSFPKFLVESEFKLKPVLKNLGITTAFSDFADFSGISKEPLKVDEVIQKAFINVTETGTEAAAATAAKVFQPCNFLPPNGAFYANHPFLYYIKTNKNITLFVGTVKTFVDYYDDFYKGVNA